MKRTILDTLKEENIKLEDIVLFHRERDIYEGIVLYGLTIEYKDPALSGAKSVLMECIEDKDEWNNFTKEVIDYLRS